MSSGTLYIPVSHSRDAVAVPLDPLPPASSGSFNIVDLLRSESAPADIWRRLALAYFDHDQLDAFEHLLQELTRDDSQDHYGQDEKQKEARVRAFNTLAAYETRKGSLSASHSSQDAAYNEATDLYNRSSDIDPNATLTWVGKGILMLLKGNIEEAQNFFKSALISDQQKESVLARLGLACVFVHKKLYHKALELYTAVLQINPALPSYIRLGFAICYYHLGDITSARNAFQRVLDISENGENVHALLGLATIEMNSWRERANQIEIDARKNTNPAALQAQMQALENDASISRGFAYLERAFRIDPQNPHALLLMSHHAFLSNRIDKSREYATRAELVINSAPSLNGNESAGYAAYAVARSHHIDGQHERAFIKYEEARRKMPTHPPTNLGYAQMLVSCRGETEQAIEVLEAVITAGVQNQQTPTAVDKTTGVSILDTRMASAASNNFEVLRLLGSLYSSQPSASALMTKAAALNKQSSKDKKHGKNQAEEKEILTLPNYERSYNYLKKCVDLNPNSLELLLEFAEVSTRLNEYESAYLSYKRCLKLMTDLYKVANSAVSSELLNNYAVVCQKMNKLSEAKELYQWALRNSSTNVKNENDMKDDSQHQRSIQADKVTTQYNLSLLAYEQGDVDAALKGMDEILVQYPMYIDALLYEGQMKQHQGDFEQAKAKYDQALNICTTPASVASASPETAAALSAHLPSIHCAIGNWHLSRRDQDSARSAFDSILTKLPSSVASGQRKDEYAKLSLGNISMMKLLRKLKTLQLTHPGKPMDHPDVARKYAEIRAGWKDVAAFYMSVLRSDSKNLYAAHGLACLLAHQGKFHEAKDMFQNIRDLVIESAQIDEMPDVFVNLGHIYTQQGSWLQAIKMYNQALKTFRGDQSQNATSNLTMVQIYSYLSRAYYLSDAFQDAKKTLMKAIQISPLSTVLWYNLGLISEAYAIDIFQKPPHLRSYREVELAILELNRAHQIFLRLQVDTSAMDKEESAQHGDIREKAGRHSMFCGVSIKNGQPHLQYARERESEQQKLLDASKEIKSRLDAEQEQARQRAAEAAEAARQKAEEEALAKKKYLEDISANWETVRSEENVKKEREKERASDRAGGGGGGGGGDDDDNGEFTGESEVTRRRDKVKAQATKRAAQPKKPRVKRERAESASEADDDGESRASRKPKAKKKKLKGRSKYQQAEGSDAERSPKPASDNEGGMDVNAELAARKAKASHLTSLTQSGDTSSSSKRKLTKSGGGDDDDDDDEDGDTNMKMEDDDANADATENQDDAGNDNANDGGDAGGDDEEDTQQQTKKKGRKQRRQIDDDEEEEQPTAASAMTDE